MDTSYNDKHVKANLKLPSIILAVTEKEGSE